MEGPSTTLTFLGIEFDTVSEVLRHPTEELARPKSCLKEWLGRRCCIKRDLLSLIGGGIPLLILGMVSVCWRHGHVQPSIQVQSDAAGSWGCGATRHVKWLQFRWHKEMSDFPIATKEMYPVVLAAFIWGQWWSGQHVLFQVDNNTVAAAVRSGSCRERRVMQLLRVLHFVAAKYQFTFTAEHILGSDNPVADAISRDSVPKAFSLSISSAGTSSGPSPSRHHPPSQGPKPRLDIIRLQVTVSRLFSAGIAVSTARTNRSGQRRYIAFGQQLSLDLARPSEDILCLFVAQQAESGLAYGTVKCYLSAVRHLYISKGEGDPFAKSLPKLDYVVKGVKRQKGVQPSRQRLPITHAILRAMRSYWAPQTDNFDVSMFWAACCVEFFGFLREGKFTVASAATYDPAVHLSVEDVSVDSREAPSRVRLIIKQSKTDPFGTGAVVLLSRTTNDLSPVAAVLAYLARRGSTPGPLFILEDGSPLSRQRLVLGLRQALSASGITCDAFSGHSFRIRAATTAAQRGLKNPPFELWAVGVVTRTTGISGRTQYS